MKKKYTLIVIFLLICSMAGSAGGFELHPLDKNSGVFSLFLKSLGFKAQVGSIPDLDKSKNHFSVSETSLPDTKTQYSGELFHSGRATTTKVEFYFDDNVFMKDNAVYNKELAKASCILSMTMYSKMRSKDENEYSAQDLIKLWGFEDTSKIKLANLYDDNHLTSFVIGHKDIIYRQKKATLVCINIGGTNGTIEQWSSNFTVGGSLRGPNHEGFDVTANRVNKEIEDYMSSKLREGTIPIIWISGHSRGASVANICAKNLTDKKYKCFAYTFGASKTTTAEDASKYTNIFNIINSDDVVTHIPVENWGFTLYGNTMTISVKDDLKDTWSQKLSLNTYKSYNGSLKKVASDIASCSIDRDSLYRYRDDGCIYIGVKSEKEGNELISKLKNIYAPKSLSHCSFELAEAPKDTNYSHMLKVSMQPAFFLQTTASVMANELGAIDFVTMMLPEYMETARSAIIDAYMGGTTHPHMPETYYVITENIK